MGKRKKKYKKSHQVTFVYDGWNMIGELEEQGKDSDWKTYLWGLDLSQGAQGAGGVGGLLTINGLSEADNRKKKDKPSSFLPFYDGNGNVVGLLSAEIVEQVASYVYSPFGKLLAAIEVTNVNAYKFSTKYADDETELCYCGYRYLSPTIGRWINRDPIQEEGGVNLNGFVYNDSNNGLDAHGKNLVRAIVSAGAAIATAVRAAAKVCWRVSCKTAKHGPHHFWVKGGKTCWMKHVQVDCWFKGRQKSTFNLARFEYGPCYKFKHGVRGITH